MLIHLIRHGQTDWNKEKRIQGHSESTLSAEGFAQAEALRTTLTMHPIAGVYCSPSIRTRQTAEILFGDLNLKTVYDENLREICLGPWEKNLQLEMKVKYPESFAHFWHSPHEFALEGAETFAEVQQRGVTALHCMIEQNLADHVAVISHGVLIKSILCYIEGRPLSKLWEPPEIHNCSHSVIELSTNAKTGKIIQYAGLLQ